MHKLLDTKNDVVFQKIFGMKKHKEILISFLNSILYLKGEDKIKEVTIEEKKMDVTLIANKKISILDLHVVTESNVNINVEIQLINQYNMIKAQSKKNRPVCLSILPQTVLARLTNSLL